MINTDRDAFETFMQGRAVMLSQVPVVQEQRVHSVLLRYDVTSPQWRVYQDWLATQPVKFTHQLLGFSSPIGEFIR